MDAGIWLDGQTVFVNGRQTHQVDWDLPELPYAHLGLPQYETERILTDRLASLGVAVERGVELRELHPGRRRASPRQLRHASAAATRDASGRSTSSAATARTAPSARAWA